MIEQDTISDLYERIEALERELQELKNYIYATKTEPESTFDNFDDNNTDSKDPYTELHHKVCKSQSCHNWFYSTRIDAKYCSNKCRQSAHRVNKKKQKEELKQKKLKQEKLKLKRLKQERLKKKTPSKSVIIRNSPIN